MTSYSVLPGGRGHTIIATWPDTSGDRSAKVTTTEADFTAESLAYELTRLSEAAWDVAFWLDNGHDIVAATIAHLVAALRSTTPLGEVSVDAGSRHRDTWSFNEFDYALNNELPWLLNGLTRPQRLAVAHELEADQTGRDELRALTRASVVSEEPWAQSRAWQGGEITRVFGNGRGGPLPESGADWVILMFGYEVTFHGRLAARRHILRIEQLSAACLAAGGRGGPDPDPPQAHLVMPRDQPEEFSDVYYIAPRVRDKHRDPHAPMEVRHKGPDVYASSTVTGELDPSDDGGFERLLGPWTRLIPFRA